MASARNDWGDISLFIRHVPALSWKCARFTAADYISLITLSIIVVTTAARTVSRSFKLLSR
jgi:hypothetical protein